MAKRKIDYRQILKQLGEDLIGKDSYRGVTFTYSWLANQFGHYSLGYIPTLVAFAALERWATWENKALWAALMVSGFWLIFEVCNFLGPLLLNRQSSAQNLYIPSKQKYVFQPDWKNVAFDTFTDLLFFWFGAFSAGILLDFPNPVLNPVIIVTLIVLALALLYPAYYWFLTKMYLQYAKFPVQYRLSQWTRLPDNDQLDKSDIQTVNQYLKNATTSNGHHLLVFGGRRSGKNTLGIGIATELAIRHRTCSYYSAIQLFNTFSLTEEQIMESDECKVWSWRSASVLVIDDINPGRPMQRIFVSAQDILHILNGGEIGENRQTIRNKNVIWIVGDDAGNGEEWKNMLLEIGVHQDKIRAVGLGYAMM